MAKKALIDTLTTVNTGYRVAQVEESSNIFPVGEPIHYWIDCPDDVLADHYWFDPSNNTFIAFPIDNTSEEEIYIDMTEEEWIASKNAPVTDKSIKTI